MSDQKRQKTTAAASNAGGGGGGGGALVSYTYATRYSVTDMPKYKMPSQGCPAPVAKQLILDERLLDSRPHLNLASFVTTWMEPEVIEIMKEALDVNYVDMLHRDSEPVRLHACRLVPRRGQGGQGRWHRNNRLV
jgi:hypothetical protein